MRRLDGRAVVPAGTSLDDVSAVGSFASAGAVMGCSCVVLSADGPFDERLGPDPPSDMRARVFGARSAVAAADCARLVFGARLGRSAFDARFFDLGLRSAGGCPLRPTPAFRAHPVTVVCGMPRFLPASVTPS